MSVTKTETVTYYDLTLYDSEDYERDIRTTEARAIKLRDELLEVLPLSTDTAPPSVDFAGLCELAHMILRLDWKLDERKIQHIKELRDKIRLLGVDDPGLKACKEAVEIARDRHGLTP